MNTLVEASDEALLLAYAAGDAGAFETLYARHRGRLYHYLLRQLCDVALTEELFQDRVAAGHRRAPGMAAAGRIQHLAAAHRPPSAR